MLYRNSAGRNGGCFFLDRNSFLFIKTYFIKNTASNGGAMYIADLIPIPEMRPGGPWQDWFVSVFDLRF